MMTSLRRKECRKSEASFICFVICFAAGVALSILPIQDQSKTIQAYYDHEHFMGKTIVPPRKVWGDGTIAFLLGFFFLADFLTRESGIHLRHVERDVYNKIKTTLRDWIRTGSEQYREWKR